MPCLLVQPPRTPIALWALQAPTLLTLLAATDAWDLRVEPMGDHEGLAEAALGSHKRLGADRPDVIFVCTPKHLETAHALIAEGGYRDVPIVWVCHNGFEPELAHGWTGPLLVFSTSNVHVHAPAGRDDVYVIRPHVPPHSYACAPPLQTEKVLWTMRNRPQTREIQQRLRTEQVESAVDAAGVRAQYTVYGQDQPGGFLGPDDRQHLVRRCIAYVSGVPLSAGFGLAEHEALAAGCPLVALAWGDTLHTLAGYPGLVRNEAQMAALLHELARIAATDPEAFLDLRWAWAKHGDTLLLTHYSLAGMNAGIRSLLSSLL